MESEYVRTSKVELAGIPCLKVAPRGDQGPLPTVMYYHGWQSDKDNQLFRLSVFAAFGIQVFAPDAMYHGERKPAGFDKRASVSKHFWDIVLQSVKESGPLIEGIASQHPVGKIGVMGHSMGGFTAAGVLAANDEIGCMVSFNGACAWIKTEELLRQKEGLPPIAAGHRDLARSDPLNNKEKLTGRPVLMLHGANDDTVPVESQRYFYSQVAKQYADCPERLVLREFPAVGHAIDVKMLEQAIAWFRKYLD